MQLSALVIATSLFAPVAVASAQGINDAQIASIVVTANQVDIDAGNLAKSTSKNDEVKKFAQTMVTDHTGVNKSATDLVTKLKVTPQDNETSKSLQEGGQKNLTDAQGAQRRGVRQGLHRPRSGLSPAGPRRRRQDTDSVGEERGAQGAPGQGPAGVRRSSRAREAPPGHTLEVSGRDETRRLRNRRLRRDRGGGALGHARHPSAAVPAAVVHTVTIDGTQFQPGDITIEVGRLRRVGEPRSVPPHRDCERWHVRLEGDCAGQVVDLHRAGPGRHRVRVHPPPDDEGSHSGAVTAGVRSASTRSASDTCC